MNEATIKHERDGIERAFFHDWKGRGKVILRKDKEQVTKELDRLVAVITEYHQALQAKFVDSKQKFREQLVGEFLGLWKKSPPDHLLRRGKPDEDSCRKDIESEADKLFEKAVAPGTTAAKVIYKDISIEDLKDEELMASLRKLMESARVDAETIKKLFQSGDAAAAQGLFWEN